jgi:hypothetical protein
MSIVISDNPNLRRGIKKDNLERRVFYIDVGKMPQHRAKRYLEQLKNEIKQNEIVEAIKYYPEAIKYYQNEN